MSSINVQLRDGTRSAATYRVIRVVMLVLTTLATMVVLLITPFKAEEGEFIHALRSGEISSVAVGSSADFFAGPGLRAGSYDVTDDVAVSWVSPFGFRREAVLSDLHMLDTNAETTPSLPHLDPPASIAKTAQRLGVVAPTMVRPGELPYDRFAWLTWLATFLMICLMLAGPQPRRTTRWGAFWAYLAPLHIGIFYALLRDSPWVPEMNRVPEPEPRDRVFVDPVTSQSMRRIGGGLLFVWSVLFASFALSLVMFGVVWALPTYVDPVVWSAVDMAGNRLR